MKKKQAGLRWIFILGLVCHALSAYGLQAQYRVITGGEEYVHTMVRPGFKEEVPDAYAVLKQISYRPEDLERLMLWIHEDKEADPYAQALRWIELHPNTVESWIEGIE